MLLSFVMEFIKFIINFGGNLAAIRVVFNITE